MGSWKTIDIFLPRIPSQSLSVLSLARSRPSNIAEPESTQPLWSSMPMNDFVSTDFPEPDSPTMARVSPSFSSRLAPRIAVRVLPRRPNFMTRPFASSIVSPFAMMVAPYTWLRGSEASENALPST